MIVTLITYGIPNKTSEQANCDPWLFAKEFEKRKIKINIVSIWDAELNTSKESKIKQITYLKKKFSNLNKFIIINSKRKKISERINRFLFRIVSNSPHYFYGSKEIKIKTITAISKLNSNKFICFFELPASILSSIKKRFYIYNYLGAYRKKTEQYRLKNLIRLLSK